jgi:hypothetical protein
MTKLAEAQPRPYRATKPALERVNARLDETTARELQQLMRDTGLSVTDVIRESIHRYYLQETVQQHSVLDVFTDLVGGIEAPAELSANYKSELRASLTRKHG